MIMQLTIILDLEKKYPIKSDEHRTNLAGVMRESILEDDPTKFTNQYKMMLEEMKEKKPMSASEIQAEVSSSSGGGGGGGGGGGALVDGGGESKGGGDESDGSGIGAPKKGDK